MYIQLMPALLALLRVDDVAAAAADATTDTTTTSTSNGSSSSDPQRPHAGASARTSSSRDNSQRPLPPAAALALGEGGDAGGGMDWGVVAVYSCADTCVAGTREWAVVQPPVGEEAADG